MPDRRTFNDLSVTVCKLDRILSEHIKHRMEEEGFTDIPSSSVAILLPLLLRDGQTLSELCRKTCMKAPTVTVIANRLEKLNLVRRERGNGDRRLVHLYLTKSGREKAVALNSLWRKLSRKMAGGLTGEMLVQANDTLNKIIKNVYDVTD